MPCFGDVFPSCRNTLRLVSAPSIFTSLYATLLRIASLLLIFFALHRHLLCSASSRSVLSASSSRCYNLRRPRSLPSTFLSFSLSLIQFILLRSDSPFFPQFILLCFALILCYYIPLRFASLGTVPTPPSSASLHYFASLHYPSC